MRGRSRRHPQHRGDTLRDQISRDPDGAYLAVGLNLNNGERDASCLVHSGTHEMGRQRRR